MKDCSIVVSIDKSNLYQCANNEFE